MTLPELVFAGPSRAVLQGVPRPQAPPTRIYLGDLVYKLQAPRVALPPIVNVAKVVLNWANLAGRFAKNVMHIKTPATGYPTSDPAKLLDLANFLMNTLTGSTPLAANISSNWTLNGITASDLGGTTASATSTVSALPGTNATAPLPPQVAVCLSWQVAESYRGGKPRTYLPGIPTAGLLTTGSSQLSAAYAAALESAAVTFRGLIAGHTPSGASGPLALGAVSYYHGHAVRPTPVFFTFIDVKVHERLDSQRRRSGAESIFPVTP